MRREATTVDRDAYWYRLVALDDSLCMFYSWGTQSMEHYYRANLRYLGAGSYHLSERTYNGMRYKPDETIRRKHRRRVRAYHTTLSLIARMLQSGDGR